jgi:hypothetical protein
MVNHGNARDPLPKAIFEGFVRLSFIHSTGDNSTIDLRAET